MKLSEVHLSFVQNACISQLFLLDLFGIIDLSAHKCPQFQCIFQSSESNIEDDSLQSIYLN